MLPPDISSNLLPWRVMVPLMQLSGCFPYKMSTTGGPPAFSLTLCLWAVFYQMVTIPTIFMIFTSAAKYHLTPKLGTTVFIYISSFSLCIVSLLPLLLGVKSPELAEALHALSGLQGVAPPPAQRWYCKPPTLAFLSLFICSTVFMTWYVTTAWEYQEFLAVVLMLATSVWFNLHLVLPVQLFAMVFGLLARRLVASTMHTVAVVSAFLVHDGSVKSESDVRAAMLELCDLQAAIREVRSKSIALLVPEHE